MRLTVADAGFEGTVRSRGRKGFRYGEPGPHGRSWVSRGLRGREGVPTDAALPAEALAEAGISRPEGWFLVNNIKSPFIQLTLCFYLTCPASHTRLQMKMYPSEV